MVKIEPRNSQEPNSRLTRLVCLPCQPSPAFCASGFSITGAVSTKTFTSAPERFEDEAGQRFELLLDHVVIIVALGIDRDRAAILVRQNCQRIVLRPVIQAQHDDALRLRPQCCGIGALIRRVLHPFHFAMMAGRQIGAQAVAVVAARPRASVDAHDVEAFGAAPAREYRLSEIEFGIMRRPAAGRARGRPAASGSRAATSSAHTIPRRREIRSTALRRNNPAPTDAPPPPDRPATGARPARLPLPSAARPMAASASLQFLAPGADHIHVGRAACRRAGETLAGLFIDDALGHLFVERPHRPVQPAQAGAALVRILAAPADGRDNWLPDDPRSPTGLRRGCRPYPRTPAWDCGHPRHGRDRRRRAFPPPSDGPGGSWATASDGSGGAWTAFIRSQAVGKPVRFFTRRSI